AHFLALIKANKWADTTGWLNFIQLDFINRTGTTGRLLGFRGVGREAAHEALQFSNLCFFLGVITKQTLTQLRGRRHVLVIVTWIQTNLSVIQVSHVRTHTVEKVSIVGNDNHGAVTVTENIFQPSNGVDIKVVGWLI